MKILLVEDDKTLFKQLKKELEHWDLHVEGVEDFGNVSSEAEQKNPEIIIMDIELPNTTVFIGADKFVVNRMYRFYSYLHGTIQWIK